MEHPERPDSKPLEAVGRWWSQFSTDQHETAEDPQPAPSAIGRIALMILIVLVAAFGVLLAVRGCGQ